MVVMLPLERELQAFIVEDSAPGQSRETPPATSNTVQMLFGDTIAVALMKARGLTQNECALPPSSPTDPLTVLKHLLYIIYRTHTISTMIPWRVPAIRNTLQMLFDVTAGVALMQACDLTQNECALQLSSPYRITICLKYLVYLLYHTHTIHPNYRTAFCIVPV